MASISIPGERDAVWYWTLVVLIGITTVFGNTLVIYLIIKRPSLHVTANWFILSLSFADLLVGLVVIPTYIIHTFWIPLNIHALITFYNLVLYVSVGNLCVMTGDRYLAITRPLRYCIVMTRSKVVTMISISWIIPTFISLLPSLLWEKSLVNSRDKAKRVYTGVVILFLEITPCFMMVLVYCHLYVITRAHSRRIAAQESVQQRYCDRIIPKKRRQRSRERSNLKVFASVVLLFIFCWLLSAYRGFCDVFGLCTVTIKIVRISRILIFLNSAVNVIVYSFVKRDIRVELKRLFGRRSSHESLDFGLCQVKESAFATTLLVKDDALAVYRYSSIFTLYVTNLIESIIWSFCEGLFGCLKVKLLWVSGFLIFLSRLVSGSCVPIRRFLKLLSNVPGAELEIGHCSKIVIIKIYHMTKAILVL